MVVDIEPEGTEYKTTVLGKQLGTACHHTSSASPNALGKWDLATLPDSRTHWSDGDRYSDTAHERQRSQRLSKVR